MPVSVCAFVGEGHPVVCVRERKRVNLCVCERERVSLFERERE